MEPQNDPSIISDRGSNWLAFTANHDLPAAIARFVERFGCPPAAWAIDPVHRLLLVGPVVEVAK